MKKFLASMLASLFVMGSVQSATVVYLDFDHTAANPGPDPYTASGTEILPSGVSGARLENTAIAVPSVVGPQGGNVLSQMQGAAWPNNQGYAFTDTTPANLTGSSYTLEFLARPDFTPAAPYGLSATSTIFSTVSASLIGSTSLSVNQNTGILTFFPSNYGGDTLSSTAALVAGEWYHIGVVVDGSGANATLEMFINYQSQGVQSIFGSSNYLLPDYFNIGGTHNGDSQRNWQGEMDAFAISDTVLSPGSFVLPNAVPEPGTLGLVIVAFSAMSWGASRRPRSSRTLR